MDNGGDDDDSDDDDDTGRIEELGGASVSVIMIHRMFVVRSISARKIVVVPVVK